MYSYADIYVSNKPGWSVGGLRFFNTLCRGPTDRKSVV